VGQAHRKPEVLAFRVREMTVVTLAHLPQTAVEVAAVLVLLEELPHRMLGATVAMV
tara:strand:- start:143 stop:310 length:168 start_codon:yes stop_codon:yes gene_type:complete